MTISNIFKKFFTTLGIIVLELFKLRPWMVWDMDGCIANIYEHDDYLEKLDDKRFFLETNAYYETIEALKLFIEKHPFWGVAICSKPMPNSWCRIEKDGWLNTYLPEIKVRMYVPATANKSIYIKKKLYSRKIYFFDDYTHNLIEMENSKVCCKVIKVKNQINCKNGVWKGPILNTYEVAPETILKEIEEICDIA